MLQGPYTNPSVSSLSFDQSYFSHWQDNSSSALASDGKTDTALINLGNAKNLHLFCLM